MKKNTTQAPQVIIVHQNNWSRGETVSEALEVFYKLHGKPHGKFKTFVFVPIEGETQESPWIDDFADIHYKGYTVTRL